VLRLCNVLNLSNVREYIRVAVPALSVLAAATAMVALACMAPPPPSDTAQATPAWMYRLVSAI
jgi:hypothetical protein